MATNWAALGNAIGVFLPLRAGAGVGVGKSGAPQTTVGFLRSSDVETHSTPRPFVMGRGEGANTSCNAVPKDLGDPGSHFLANRPVVVEPQPPHARKPQLQGSLLSPLPISVNRDSGISKSTPTLSRRKAAVDSPPPSIPPTPTKDRKELSETQKRLEQRDSCFSLAQLPNSFPEFMISEGPQAKLCAWSRELGAG